MSRPKQGEKYSGDAYLIKNYGGIHFASLIDGLGHGEKANYAAKNALRYVSDNFKRDFENIFQGVHRACRTSR